MTKGIRGILAFIGISLRGLRQRKARTLLTVMGVTVGVAALISVSITEETAQRSISDIYGGAAGEADLIVTNATATIGDTEGFDSAKLAVVKGTAGVELAAPLLQFTTTSSGELEDWEPELNPAAANGTLFYGIDPASSLSIGHYDLVSGDPLTEDSDSGVLLNVSYADSLDIGLGDTIQLVVPGGTADFEVIGLIGSEGLAQLNKGKVVLANLDTVANAAGRTGKLDQIDVVAVAGVDSGQLSQNLSAALGPGYRITPPEAKGEQTDDIAALIVDALDFTALLVAAVGILLIYNTFATTVAERSFEMALMRAIGAGKSHLIGVVIGEACLLGAVGTLLGIPLGVGLARGLGRIIEETTGAQMNNPTLLPEHVVYAFLAGVGIALVASLIPAIQSSRLSPMEAMVQHREISRSRSRRKLIPGVILLGAGSCVFFYHFFRNSDITFEIAFGLTMIAVLGIILLISEALPPFEHMISRSLSLLSSLGEIGGRNMGRKPARTALTAGILVIGIASIVFTEGVNKSQDDYNGQFLDKMIGSDLIVQSPQRFPTEIVEEIDAMPGVRKATGTGFVPANMLDPGSGDTVAGVFYAFDTADYGGDLWDYDWVDFAGSTEEALAKVGAGDTVFVESYTAEHYGFDVGDFITLQTLKGEQDFEIAAIVYGRTWSGFGVMGSWSDAINYFGTDKAGTAKILLNPGYDSSSVKADIEERWGETYHLSVVTYEDYYSKLMADINQASSSSDVMLLIAFVIVVLAITNTLLMNVWERRRELGMLRAIGTTRRQMVGIVAAEGVAIGLLGGVLGVGLGLFGLPTVVDSWDSLLEMGIEYRTIIPYKAIVVAMVVSVAVSLVSSLLPAWKGANTNIAEAMRSE